jgi:AraC-like DNA-binding protein
MRPMMRYRASDAQRNMTCVVGEGRSEDGPVWVGTAEIADLFGCSRRLVQKSFASTVEANRVYGPDNWRTRSTPISRKRVYQVRLDRVRELIGEHAGTITKENGRG